MKKGLFCLILLFSFFCFPFPALAEGYETDTLPDSFADLTDSLLEEIRAYLPDGLFSLKTEDVAKATKEMSSFSYLFKTVLSLCEAELGGVISLAAGLAGILMLASLFNLGKSFFRSEGIQKAFSFVSSLAILVLILREGYRPIEETGAFFEKISQAVNLLIPLEAALYTMGGNVTAAAASASGLSIYLAVLDQAVAKSILPFAAVCLSFAVVSAGDAGIRLGTLADTVKKNYTTLLSFLMMLLLAMLSSQTLLGAKSDSLTMKSAKFVAGNLIPVVGGSVSELLRTVSAGVGYLRGTVGICGTLLLFFLLMPTVIRLFLTRTVFGLCASLAELLGCDGEKRLLSECSSLTGYLIAAALISSSVLFLSINILTHCASAFG